MRAILSCPGCFVHKTTDPDNSFTKIHKKCYPDEISFDTQVALFEEAQSLGVKIVDIVGAGEPTLDPHFDLLIDKLIQLNLYSVVFTHGATPLFQDINKLSLYKDKPISFFIKLWSCNKELHNQYVQGALKNYAKMRDKALDNLQKLGFMKGNIINIDGIDRKTTRIGADILVMKSNYNEIPDIFKFCRENNIMPEIKTYIPEGPTRFDHEQGYFTNLPESTRKELKKDEISPEEFALLRRELEKIDQEEYGNDRIPYFYPQAVFCTQSMASIYVTIRGDIYNCVGSHYSYGKYEAGKHQLQNIIMHRKEKVSLGCIPRVMEAKRRGMTIPKKELEILTLGAKLSNY